MNISIKGLNNKETTAISDYVKKRAEKFFKIDSSITKVDIVLDSRVARGGVSSDFEVVLRVHVPGKTETVTEADSTMYSAIDDACLRMLETLRRRKEKLVSKKEHAQKNLREIVGI